MDSNLETETDTPNDNPNVEKQQCNIDKRETVKQDDAHLEQANKLFQMGVMLIHGKRKSVEKAIKCIQRAITLNDADYKFWQILGEAYYQRGSLNPAINCFMKSLKLAEQESEDCDSNVDGMQLKNEYPVERKRQDDDCIYSRLRMSDIRLSVGHLDEAALGYNEIIAHDPSNIAALVGLSRTELQLARNSFSAGLVKLGHSHCLNALRFSLRAIKLNPNLCLTWKLASDCCLIQFVYGQRGKFISEIRESFPGSENDVLLVDKKVCIELAQQFLCKALEIEPYQDSPCLWHNLGISLYLRSSTTEKVNERNLFLKRSIKCLLKALDLDRDNSQIKNSIGVVAFNLNLMNTAQSFLIKSIQTNLSTSEIQFSNLGYIYLQKGEFNLASVAFARCQAEEPLYSRSWLGNALINEQHNLDNLSNLRHCHRLENNYESQLLFATKVTSLPCTSERDKNLIDALDCMKRLINYDDRSLEANNTLGLLYERSNFKNLAQTCFDIAYKISPQDSRVIFNKLRLHSTATFGCPTIQNHSTTDTDFIKDAEKIVNGGNREYLLNYIYYLFSNGEYKSVNSRMTRFMDKLPRNDIRNKTGAQILLGLADKAEGCDFKSWFFKNLIDLEGEPCIEAVINLLCLMLLGAIVEDAQLVEQTSCDLEKHILTYLSARGTQFDIILYSNEGRWLRMALFCSTFCLKEPSTLIRHLLALFPTSAELWLYLGLSQLIQKAKHQSAFICIQKATLLGSSYADLGVVCDITMAMLTQFSKSRSNLNTCLDTRTVYLSRAIYRCPEYGLLWLSLLIPRKAEQRDKSKKSQLFTEDNLSLFQLIIDLIIKMILG